MTEQDQESLAQVVERLVERFPHQSRDEVARTVTDSFREFEGSRIRDFVPILVENEARNRLSIPRQRDA
ncbi:MAG: hypothetical protein HOQ22_11790 [Nocardioidaceae bacterium]|nr:hypothetical protein [Nocardioidaceae bacterium]NUS51705.1 hypothetical protein [Nocardioidaceae bacterium]